MFDESQKTEFLSNGFLMIREAFSAARAAQCAKFLLNQIDNPELDIDKEPGYVHIKENFSEGPFCEIWTDKMQNCVDALLGAGNYHPVEEWGWWPISFPGCAPDKKAEPVEGWHIDGQSFHKLDDPTAAVICLCLFTDIEPWGGGTFIEPASHKQVIRFMATKDPHSNGILHQDINDYMHSRIRGKTIEITGKAGDVVFMNPYMWHCRGHNYSDQARVICNARCEMNRRMNLKSPQNLVERSISEAMIDFAEV